MAKSAARERAAPKGGPGQQLGTQDGPFRKGQWVLVGPDEKVGIHVTASGVGSAEVHLVNEQGETTMTLPQCATKDLKPASLKHIPKARRPEGENPRYPTTRH